MGGSWGGGVDWGLGAPKLGMLGTGPCNLVPH